MNEPRGNSQQGGQGQGGQGGGGNNRRRRHRGNRSGGGPGGQTNNRPPQEGAPPRENQGQGPRQAQGQGQGQQNQQRNSSDNRNRPQQSAAKNRNRHGRPLTTNQVLVKYDNLLEQHLVTRRKYFEYFNRVDERQLRRLEKNFYDSVEHLRRFEFNLEPWQREALEKRKTERYTIDATYSLNRGLDPLALQPIEVTPEEIQDPHFKDSQKEAYVEYREDKEESMGNYEDYLKYKGQA